MKGDVTMLYILDFIFGTLFNCFVPYVSGTVTLLVVFVIILVVYVQAKRIQYYFKDKKRLKKLNKI